MKKNTLLFVLLFSCAGLFAQGTDYVQKAKDLTKKMTVEEKASLCSGLTTWSTKPITRLGIPSIFMTDGPHGLRKAEGFDFTKTVPATCFPTASALASSWNPDLLTKMGVALGEECQANDVQIILGPGVNMKRSALCGRNFEYFSEDPILAGKMAAGLIKGVQSQGVGTSLKHFAANNQEFERMIANSNMDERTLNEIYLPAFEIAVREAQPWTVMCAYNRVQGVYASENPYLLSETLKKRWGFKGFVVSDWGAVSDRVAGVKAGLHLEMPESNGYNDKLIVEAVKAGKLDESRLDEIVVDLLAVILKAKDSHKANATYDKQAHHDLARSVADECIVMLKNDKSILPLNLAKTKKVAIIGSFAKVPRYQGAGSSQVKTTQQSNAFDEIQKMAGKGTQLIYAQGYRADETLDEKLIAEAKEAAKQAEVAVLFVGLPDSYESEGADRKNMDMPLNHTQLIDAVTAVNPNTIVVLMNGSSVCMPWVAKPLAILECWLGGQAGGGAIADVLTGKVNPSGKLSETFPVKLEDTPSYMDFPGQNGEARYGEGIFIGYRYYDKRKLAPQFPFGFGLSYTTFAYSDIKASSTSIKDTDRVQISLKVKNTGAVEGKEIVQLYVHDQGTSVLRPEKELKHFDKVSLKPGEEKTITFQLSSRDFAYFSSNVHAWEVNSGKFDIQVGGSSDLLPLKTTIDVQATSVHYPVLTRNSLLREFAKNPKGKALYDQMIQGMMQGMGGSVKNDEESKKALESMMMYMNDMPIYKFVLMSQGKFTDEMLNGMLQMINK